MNKTSTSFSNFMNPNKNNTLFSSWDTFDNLWSILTFFKMTSNFFYSHQRNCYNNFSPPRRTLLNYYIVPNLIVVLAYISIVTYGYYSILWVKFYSHLVTNLIETKFNFFDNSISWLLVQTFNHVMIDCIILKLLYILCHD